MEIFLYTKYWRNACNKEREREREREKHVGWKILHNLAI
jgi:hypothetical protein